MIKSKRRFYYLIGCGSTLFFLAIAVWIGICLLNRPPYLMPLNHSQLKKLSTKLF